MSDQGKQNELYWKAMRERQIKDDYAAFLDERSLPRGSDSAWQFAILRSTEGAREMKERDLILLLVGELPYMYD